MIFIFIFILVMIGLITHFEPIIDKNDKGQIVINYRPHRKTKERKNIILC